MTVPYFKHFQLLFLLAIPLAKVAASQHDFVVDAVPSLIRGGSMEEELDAHGRQLSSSLSWSWTNLLCKLFDLVVIFGPLEYDGILIPHRVIHFLTPRHVMHSLHSSSRCVPCER